MTKRLWMAIVEHREIGQPRTALFYQARQPGIDVVMKRFAGLAKPKEMMLTDLFDITGEIADGPNREALQAALAGDWYTVTLYYPQHVCESGRTETYMHSCEAKSETAAVKITKQQMIEDNGGDDSSLTADEIEVCSVQRGDHEDIK